MPDAVHRVTTRDAIETGIAKWNERHEAFAIPADIVAQNVFAPFAGVTVSAWALEGDPETGFALGKRPTDAQGPYPAGSTAWISLAVAPDRERTIRLLEGLTSRLARDSVETVAFGRGPQHIVPGIPTTLSGYLRAALRAAQFTFGDRVVDMTQRLATAETPPSVAETRATWECRLERATENSADLFSVLAHFGERWQYEAENVARLPGGLSTYWVLYADDEAVGFLRASTPESTFQAPGRTWANRVDESVVGIGPLGIRPDARGQGWGLAMIDAVLDHYHECGIERAVVDWTDLRTYYRKLGFDPWIEYEYAERSLL
ncbi:MAG: GNAT family N-acetyltransferase [Halorhabdus sp.]